jgi:hypothetical protein
MLEYARRERAAARTLVATGVLAGQMPPVTAP